MAKAKQNRSKTGMRWGEGTVRERLGASGKTAYQARWIDEAGQHAQSFPSRDDAEDFLRDQHRAKRDGRYSPPSELTVRQLMEGFLARGATRWTSPNTYYAYEQRARLYICPALGEIRAATLTTPRLQHWIDGMTADGKTPSLVKAAAIVLKQAFKEAAGIGFIASNPCIGLRLPAVPVKTAVTWTVDEVTRFSELVAADPMWRALYRLALTTGMRPGELRSLRWSDVNFEQGLLVVARTMSRDREGRSIVGKTTKTKHARPVALTSSAVEALSAWRKSSKVVHLNGYIFGRSSTKPLDESNWREQHQRFCDKAGVRVITLHELRHTNATQDMEAGAHPLIVSQRLGHASVTTTLDRYSHVSVDLQRAAAEALDKRLFGGEDTTTTTRDHG